MQGAIAGVIALVVGSWLTALADETATPIAVGARLSQDANRALLAFDLSRPVEARVYALASPDRVVLDLQEINFQLDASVGRLAGANVGPVVKAFRFGRMAPHTSQIVIDLAQPACPIQVESKPIADGATASRLKIELKPCDATAFAALSRPPDVSADVRPGSAPIAAPVIVIDPGHGGSDGGARGIGGALEKTLVFAFCGELKRQLAATKRYTVLMTRNGDEYVDLDDRVSIAREANASLFVSVHADTVGEESNVGGTTVYTVADGASDAEAARIAARENAAGRGRNGKLDSQEDPGISDILFDLKRRETRIYAHVFSRNLVENLRVAARLNHNPERSAAFVVLKAPEFPSVLVELGYLSNPQDVQSMTSQDWRAKTASAMVHAVDTFFDHSAGTGVAAAGETDPAASNR
jgi:N-acetylmuramoyl-L-alanine amidase